MGGFLKVEVQGTGLEPRQCGGFTVGGELEPWQRPQGCARAKGRSRQPSAIYRAALELRADLEVHPPSLSQPGTDRCTQHWPAADPNPSCVPGPGPSPVPGISPPLRQPPLELQHCVWLMSDSDSVMADSDSTMADSNCMIAESSGMMVDSTGMMVDSTGMVADSTGMVDDRTNTVADRTNTVADRYTG